MTAGGARGETLREMRDVLHFDLPDAELHETFRRLRKELDAGGGGRELHLANRLWIQKGYALLGEYLRLTESAYGAGLAEVDFERATEAARREINAWVEERTQRKIRDLLQPGDADSVTALVLTNAIYFKAAWLGTFDRELTRDAAFTLPGGCLLYTSPSPRD